LRPRRSDEPVLKPDPIPDGVRPESFDKMIERWFPLTYVLNNLNRGLGMPDAYPFVLPPVAIEKLRFVHETVGPGSHAPAWEPGVPTPERGNENLGYLTAFPER
jgi:hypothetical protein